MSEISSGTSKALPVMVVTELAGRQQLALAFKRAIDIVGSIILLILLSPLFLLLAIAIKLDSVGPAIYRRRVFGYQERTFWVYKFRSMVPDADGLLQTDAKLREYIGPSFK